MTPQVISHHETWLRSFHLQEALPTVIFFYSAFWRKKSDLFLGNSNPLWWGG